VAYLVGIKREGEKEVLLSIDSVLLVLSIFSVYVGFLLIFK
jgi:hypothetical protein